MQTRHDVTVVGNQTAGANGNVSFIDLPGGIRTCFSGLGWFYNDGRPVQRQGVRIDVEVQPTLAGIMAGRDEVLDKAIEELTQASGNGGQTPLPKREPEGSSAAPLQEGCKQSFPMQKNPF